MPPKPKFTKEEVARAAFQIIKYEGLSNLTARDLGARMGTSSRPIFTVFKSMEEVKLAARELALAEFHEYLSDYHQYTPAFKRVGALMVSYAIHEPELFKLLFMQQHENRQDFQSTLNDLGSIVDICISMVQRDYEITEEEAKFLFEQMWTHCYGLCVMCVTGVCNFTEDEIGIRQGNMFASQIMLIKSGKYKEIYTSAEKNRDGLFAGRRVQDIPYILHDEL